MSNVSACCTKVALVLALSQLAQYADAQPAVAAPRRAVSAQTVSQKISMLNQVLNHSQVAIRVQASGSDQAWKHLSAARDLTARARSLSAAGQLGSADALLDEAIWEVSRAQQLVPDPAARQVSEREHYLQLESSVAALRRASQMAPAGATPAAGERPTARADVLVEKAIGLAAGARYAEASQQLDQALALLLHDVSANLGGRTVVYDGRFADRHQEFEFELERHRSFERLVPLALTELRPPPEALAAVERYVATARELRARGEAMAAADIGAAIGHVVAGTDALRRALQASGLVVPQAMGEK